MSKSTAQRIHANRRMLERYDISLNRRDLKQMVASIQKSGKMVQFVDRQSNRVTRWHVQHEGKWYPVVYDSNRKTIVTILPEGALGHAPELR